MRTSPIFENEPYFCRENVPYFCRLLLQKKPHTCLHDVATPYTLFLAKNLCVSLILRLISLFLRVNYLCAHAANRISLQALCVCARAFVCATNLTCMSVHYFCMRALPPPPTCRYRQDSTTYSCRLLAKEGLHGEGGGGGCHRVRQTKAPRKLKSCPPMARRDMT